MKIAEFEKICGLPRDTLRYYEKIGILTPPSRRANGYREYGQVQLEELAFIQKGKEIGFSLSAIKEGYQHYKNLGYFCPNFLEQLYKRKAELSQQIAHYKRAISEIDKILTKAGHTTNNPR